MCSLVTAYMRRSIKKSVDRGWYACTLQRGLSARCSAVEVRGGWRRASSGGDGWGMSLRNTCAVGPAATLYTRYRNPWRDGPKHIFVALCCVFYNDDVIRRYAPLGFAHFVTNYTKVQRDRKTFLVRNGQREKTVTKYKCTIQCADIYNCNINNMSVTSWRLIVIEV